MTNAQPLQSSTSGPIKLVIPKASPSLNRTTGTHWIHYRREKKLWEKLIWIAKVEAGIYAEPMFLRSRVRIVREGAKMLDLDNLIGGVKPLVDALKALGIIVDDSTDHIALTVEQLVGKERRTTIHVEQIDCVAVASNDASNNGHSEMTRNS